MTGISDIQDSWRSAEYRRYGAYLCWNFPFTYLGVFPDNDEAGLIYFGPRRSAISENVRETVTMMLVS